MRSALRHTPGVECAHADVPTRTATIECRTDCDREALLAALRRKGIDGVITEPGAREAQPRPE